ncbi:MAG: nucleotide exchange factor GrpE [Anaerolineae bacterium]|nr:nucleotide exchange factor GrpE [Anaerolineae bacterium]
MTKKKSESMVEEPAAAQDVAQPEAELAQLQADLEAAQAQAAEYLDGWRRSQAEFSNYRKRQEADWQRRVELSNAGLIASVLPVLDDLGRALRTLPVGLERLTWIEGVLIIFRKLEKILEMEGVKPIETEGLRFDPLVHEAITYEELAGYEDGQIIGEVQRGYMLGERVIRPALVRVAKAPLPAEPAPRVEEDSADVPPAEAAQDATAADESQE